MRGRQCTCVRYVFGVGEESRKIMRDACEVHGVWSVRFLGWVGTAVEEHFLLFLSGIIALIVIPALIGATLACGPFASQTGCVGGGPWLP